MPQTEQLKQVFELEIRLRALRQQSRALEEGVKQAKYAQRAARIAQVEYGGITAFLDKLSGKYPDKAESLDREVRRAEAELNSLLRQQEENAAAIAECTRTRSALPEWESMKQPETEKTWAVLELQLCAEELLPLLEKTEGALQEYRRCLRGEIPMLSIERQQEISTEPDVWGKQCTPILERMASALSVLGQPAEIEPFFRAPAYFLASAAARHNQINRAVQALDQVHSTLNRVHRLSEQSNDPF